MKRICAILVVLIIILPVISWGYEESCYQGNVSCYEQSTMQLSVSTMPSPDKMGVLGGKVNKGIVQSSLQNIEMVVQSSSQNCESQIVEKLLKDAIPTENSYYPASPVKKDDEYLMSIERSQSEELNKDADSEPKEGKCAISVERSCPVNTNRVASVEKEE